MFQAQLARKGERTQATGTPQNEAIDQFQPVFDSWYKGPKRRDFLTHCLYFAHYPTIPSRGLVVMYAMYPWQAGTEHMWSGSYRSIQAMPPCLVQN